MNVTLKSKHNKKGKSISLELSRHTNDSHLGINLVASNKILEELSESFTDGVMARLDNKWSKFFKIIIDDAEALSFVNSFYDDLILSDLKTLFKKREKINKFTQPYINDFITYYAPKQTDVEDDNPFEEFDSGEIDAIKYQPFEVTGDFNISVFEDKSLEIDVRNFIEHRDRYNKIHDLFNRKTLIIKRELELKIELRELQKQKLELELESLKYEKPTNKDKK